jgi:hypothetical protein
LEAGSGISSPEYRVNALPPSRGYRNCNDLSALRANPAVKMAGKRLLDNSADLASHPTPSRLQDTPDLQHYLADPHYPKSGEERHPINLGRTLRI